MEESSVNDSSKDDNRRPLHFIPFGRFRVDRDISGDSTSVLVGRERQRSFLIDALTGAPKRGAYLVTGRRGVGKTTFVHNCLSEFEANIFRRHLRSTAGRSPLDLFVTVVIIFGWIMLSLIASDFIEFVAPLVSSNAILFLLIIIALLITTTPLLYGWYILTNWERSISAKWSALLRVVLFSVSVYLACAVLPFGSPAYSILVSILAFVVLVIISFACGTRCQPLVSVISSRFSQGLTIQSVCLSIWIVRSLSVFFLPLAIVHFSIHYFEIYVIEWLVDEFRKNSTNVDDSHVALAELTKLISVSLPLLLIVGLSWIGTVFFWLYNKPLSYLRGGGGHDLTEVQARRVMWSFLTTSSICSLIFLVFISVPNQFTLSMLSIEKQSFISDAIFHFGLICFIVSVGMGVFLGLYISLSMRWIFPFSVFVCCSALILCVYGENPALRLFAATLGAIFYLSILDYLFDDLSVWLNKKALLKITNKAGNSTAKIGDIGYPADSTAIRYTKRRLVPKVEAMLFLKGLVFVALGLQLSYPLLAIGPESLAPKKPPTLPEHYRTDMAVNISGIRWPTTLSTKLQDDFLNSTPTSLHENESIWDLGGSVLESPLENSDNSNSNWKRLSSAAPLTPFGAGREDEGLWAVLVGTLVLLFYFAEHEWIGRSFIGQRQTRALDRGPRRDYLFHHDLDPSWMGSVMPRSFKDVPEVASTLRNYERNRKNRFRALESATFPYSLAKAWLPSLVVSVNLGFDKLDHRGVTHAMLYGLSNAYRKCFLSWSSPYHILGKLVLVLSVTAAVAAVGRSFVDVPYTDPVLVNEVLTDWRGPWARSGQVENQIDVVGSSRLYCPWLQRTLSIQPKQEFGPRTETSSFIPGLICEIASESGGAILSVLFAPVVAIPVRRELLPEPTLSSEQSTFRPIFTLLHNNNGLPTLEKLDVLEGGDMGSHWQLVQNQSLTLRVYHILLFSVFCWVLAFITRRVPLLPYKHIHQQIEALMSDLIASKTERVRRGKYGLARLVETAFTHEGESESTRSVLDPRSVELALMSVLEEIQARNSIRFFAPNISISLPAPEVHFVFDELDKIGGVVGAEDTTLGIGEVEKRAVDADRQRTYELHALLSDMKRVISSAPARFIFVGGRALHDEWVRDVNRMGTRQPLLSSIFDAEIYLPSLLLDLPRSVYGESLGTVNKEGGKLDARVTQYLNLLHEASLNLDAEMQLTRVLPFFALSLPGASNHDFDEYVDTSGLSMKVIDGRMRKELGSKPMLGSKLDERGWLLEDFTHFLAFRSAGSPKRLRETLQQFIRPAGAYFNANDHSRFELAPNRDMVVFDRHELYRIQFIAHVFRHIDRQFGDVLLQRDDKVAINVFFLFDYLMKLNGRAFSLSSLERLDELAHIHRAPDLRRLLEKVIGESSELFFHRIPNGLYSYRFQSDLSMEIRYLSRLSEPEMAALNFTLDESQELKTTYGAMLDASGEPNPDIISALGELYEFDQAYDIARGYYERAIRIIDSDLERQVGDSMSSGFNDAMPAPKNFGEGLSTLAQTELFSGKQGVIDFILRGGTKDRRIINAYMPWAVRRLRLMLQIGLTFEQIGDEERAQSQYYSAHMLARAITDVGFSKWHEEKDRWYDGAWLSMLLENLPLIYQPLLSSAWVSEKLDGAIDTSLEMVEREVFDMTQRFEFVKLSNITRYQFDKKYFNQGVGITTRQAAQYNQNMALVAAEIHNKAGDLYFYKGRAALSCGGSLEKVLALIHPNSKQPHLSAVQELKGYLPMARYHYCAALHEVRRFSNFRKQLSATAWNPILGSVSEKTPTLRQTHWPSFTHQIAASSLIDLGELMRAGLTMALTLGEIERDSENIIGDNYIEELDVYFDEWSEHHDTLINKISDPSATEKHPSRLQAKYLGQWVHERKPAEDYRRIRLGFEPTRHDAIFLSLHFGIMGAEQTRRSGHPLAAVKEYEIVLKHIARLLKNIQILLRLSDVSMLDYKMSDGCEELIFLFSHTAVVVLERIQGLNIYNICNDESKYQVGGSIPVTFVVNLLSLEGTLLALRSVMNQDRNRYEGVENNTRKIQEFLEPFFGHSEEQEKYDYYYHEDDVCQLTRSRLLRILDRHHYPVLAMLETKKVLVDMVALNSSLAGVCENRGHREEQQMNIDKGRYAEAHKLLAELAQQYRLFDAPMHFTPTKLAESLSLMCILSNDGEVSNRKLALDLLDEAEQSFSMGRKYYSNISRLYYLYDDFNDRSRHAEHAASMMQADVMAILRALVLST